VKTLALQPAAQSKNNATAPTGNRLITDAELKLPGVDGVTIRYRRGWDIDFIAQNVARCRKLNKLYTLLVVGGEVKNPLTESHLSGLEKLIGQLGKLYAKDSLCWGVHCAVPPYDHSEELFWGKPMPAGAIRANQRIITRWNIEFPMQMKLLAGSANDVAAMQTLIEGGVDECGPDRFLYKINSISAKLDLTWSGVGLLVWAAAYGAQIGGEMLDASTASRFGGTWKQAMAKVAAIEKKAGKKFAYLAPYRQDLKNL